MRPVLAYCVAILCNNACALRDICKNRGLIHMDDQNSFTEPDDAANNVNEDLLAFEKHIDDILSTGELDATLRVIDTEGVAQVLPVLDTEPISHLLEGIEEIGGQANVFVRTNEGIAVLNVVEYSPDDVEEEDEVITNETQIIVADGSSEEPSSAMDMPDNNVEDENPITEEFPDITQSTEPRYEEGADPASAMQRLSQTRS